MRTLVKNSLRVTKFTKRSEVPQKWYLIDADGKTLGRMASNIAKRLMGKMSPQFSPNADTGDFIVVVNAEKVKITGKRAELKDYKTHSGYPGGQKTKTYKELMQNNPEKIIELAVKRMLPKNKLNTIFLKKLKVYKGTTHPHQAQNPAELN
jgi:large subunit ribosomal protein L13